MGRTTSLFLRSWEDLHRQAGRAFCVELISGSSAFSLPSPACSLAETRQSLFRVSASLSQIPAGLSRLLFVP